MRENNIIKLVKYSGFCDSEIVNIMRRKKVPTGTRSENWSTLTVQAYRNRVIKCACGCGKEILGSPSKKYYSQKCRGIHKRRLIESGCLPIKKWKKCETCGKYIPDLDKKVKNCTPRFTDQKCYKPSGERFYSSRGVGEDPKEWRKNICFDNSGNICSNYTTCLGNPFDDHKWKYELLGKKEGCYEPSNTG